MTDWKPEEKPNLQLSDWQIAWIGLMFVLLAIAFMFPPGHAMTITMSNPGGMSERDIIAYFPNGTMQGYYNSTSVITLDANESYIFALKPIQSNPFDDPTDWFFNAFWPAIQANYIMLIFVGFLVLLWAGSRR